MKLSDASAAEMKRWLPLVQRIASRLKMRLPRHVETDDLIQWGFLGLADAFCRFDPALGVKFPAYARKRIWGGMIDGMRTMDWVPHCARYRGEEAPAVWPISGIPKTEDGRKCIVDPPDPFDGIASVEAQECVAALLRKIPSRHREIVVAYHFDQLMMSQIAARLNLTESRICQLHSDAIRLLRKAAGIESGTLSPARRTLSRPFECRQHPGRRFSANEAAELAGVSAKAVRVAVGKKQSVGLKGLEFFPTLAAA